MSRDIYVQDIPSGIRLVAEIPEDFRPRPLDATYEQIVEVIQRVAPAAEFSDPAWGTIDGDTYSIEVNIRPESPVTSFAFHVRSDGSEADHIIGDILRALSLRAFDIDDDTGIFRAPAEPERLPDA